ncbi:hypothetical protein BD413DRAFT_522786 [Trametes elegans]|nr:hypothetical protein BD413DRAFT_522786 [Trametes elegans]
MTVLTEAQKREIGQHFVFGFHGQEASEDVKTLIKDYYLGCASRPIMPDLQEYASPSSRAAETPLVVQAERNKVMRVQCTHLQETA